MHLACVVTAITINERVSKEIQNFIYVKSHTCIHQG